MEEEERISMASRERLFYTGAVTAKGGGNAIRRMVRQEGAQSEFDRFELPRAFTGNSPASFA